MGVQLRLKHAAAGFVGQTLSSYISQSPLEGMVLGGVTTTLAVVWVMAGLAAIVMVGGLQAGAQEEHMTAEIGPEHKASTPAAAPCCKSCCCYCATCYSKSKPWQHA